MEYTHRDSGTHATLAARTMRYWLRRIISGNIKTEHSLEIRKLIFLPATGEESVVSDSDQSLGQDMLTEAPDKLLV